jgi:hypothetical protein
VQVMDAGRPPALAGLSRWVGIGCGVVRVGRNLARRCVVARQHAAGWTRRPLPWGEIHPGIVKGGGGRKGGGALFGGRG